LNVDVAKPLNDSVFDELHSAFLEYSVLLFRGQRITREQHIAFSRRFGELENNDPIMKLKKHMDPSWPEILTNMAPSSSSQLWHSDLQFTCLPAMATLLHGVEIPDVGGDTMFANMSLAYDALSEGMKKLIAELYWIRPGTKSRIDESTPERLRQTKQ